METTTETPSASTSIGPTDPEAGHSPGTSRPDDTATGLSASSRQHAGIPGSAKALRDLGRASAGRGDYEDAAAKLREALELEPDDPDSYDAYNALAEALAEAQRFDEAAQRWQEAVAIGGKAQSRNRRIVLRRWGTALANRKDYDGAAAKLREALELEPDDPASYDAYNDLASALAEAQRFDDAVQRAQEAVAIGEKAQSRSRRIVLRRWGRALANRKDYDGAAAKLREALELEPDDDWTYYAYSALAEVLARAQRFDDAVRRWQEALAIGEKAQSRNRRIVLRSWGAALANRKDYDGAAAKLREAFELEPDDPDTYSAYSILAEALGKARQFDEAVRRWQEALAIGEKAQSRNRRIVLRRWGATLIDRADYEGAAAKLREALELEPDDEWTYYAYSALADALARAQRFDDAVRQEALAIGEKAQSRNRRIVLRRWGAMLIDRADYEGAGAKLREALELEPDDPGTYSVYSILAEALGKALRFDDAVRRWQEALAIGEKAQSRNRRIVLRSWGTALADRKDYDGAAAKLREAFELEPDDPDTYSAYSILAEALGKALRFDDAVRRWQEALAIGEKAQSRNRRIVLRSWGTALADRKDYDGAATKLREAFELEPDDPDTYDAYSALADALAKAQRFGDAVRRWQEALAIGEKAQSRNRRIVLRRWGDRLIDEGGLDEPLGKYLQALELNPDDRTTFECFSRLARALAQGERFSEIPAVFEKAKEKLDADSEQSAALGGWSLTLYSLGFFDDAVETIRQALKTSPDDAFLNNLLGLTLKARGQRSEAIEQYRKSHEISRAQGDEFRKLALTNWAYALLDLERFPEALERARQAVEAAPDDFWRYFDYANILADSGRADEALFALGQAIERDRKHPHPHHNRANLLFELGRYREGWEEWNTARDCYREVIDKAEDSERADLAHDFASILAGIFNDYSAAERYFTIAVGIKGYDDAKWRTFAGAYQAWANADQPPSDIHARLSPALQKAIALSKRRLGKGNDFETLLALADLHIDTQDWIAGRGALEQAAQLCEDSLRRRAEVDRRQGLLELRAERYADAVESFRKAISFRRSDLELRTNLGKALLRAKRLVQAREEFNKVLKSAPGNIDALIGLAQVCIELAEDGETEYYQQAEQRLSEALGHGRNANTGSKRLQDSSLEDALYLRGFARTKRWEAGGIAARPLTLLGALRDFSECKRHPQAPTARAKVVKHLMHTASDTLFAKFAVFVMFCAMAAVFVLVQLDFFFEGYGLLSPRISDALTYSTLTFGAFLFMIVILYLPNLLKLKVAGIELEKTAATQISAPSSLGISRPSSLSS